VPFSTPGDAETPKTLSTVPEEFEFNLSPGQRGFGDTADPYPTSRAVSNIKTPRRKSRRAVAKFFKSMVDKPC
jgi:hypothetical protein